MASMVVVAAVAVLTKIAALEVIVIVVLAVAIAVTIEVDVPASVVRTTLGCKHFRCCWRCHRYGRRSCCS